jgi:uncharacterized phage protein (TIGR02220 family)
MAGFVALHRCIVTSDIYLMHPLYLRVFERLIIEANHKDNEIPYENGVRTIQRGQRLTSIRQIAEWVAWYEKGQHKVPNPRTIRKIIDWLEKNGMILIDGEKGRDGNRKETLYTIENYEKYQTIDTPKVTVRTPVRTPLSTRCVPLNNKGNNDNNDKQEKILIIVGHLNEKAKTSFQPTSTKTARLITARFADGFTVDDFKAVIDKKCAGWMDTEWQKFLRPETLFGSKFEGYLNEKEAVKHGTDKPNDVKNSGFTGEVGKWGKLKATYL